MPIDQNFLTQEFIKLTGHAPQNGDWMELWDFKGGQWVRNPKYS